MDVKRTLIGTRYLPGFLRRSLQARLVTEFVLLCFVLLTVVGFLAYSSARNTLRESALERLAIAVDLKERQLTRWVDEHARELQHLASIPDLREAAARLVRDRGDASRAAPAYRTVRAYLEAKRRTDRDFAELFVLSNYAGQTVLSTDSSHEGEYRLRDAFFEFGRHGLHVENVYPSPVTFKPTLTISLPLEDPAGERYGVLAAHLNLEEMDRIVGSGEMLGQTAESYLVDRYNEFVSSERFGRDPFPRGVHTVGIDAAIEGEDGYGAYANYDGVPVIGVYRWVEDLEVALIAEITQREAFQQAGEILIRIIILGVVIGGLVSLSAVAIAQQITSPVLRVSEAATRVADGNLDVTAPATTEDEVGVLAHTFNHMTRRLRILYRDLEEENAARKHAEEEVRALNVGLEQHVAERTRQLELANRELEAFTYSVSHDLRAPLRAIDGFMQILSDTQAARLDGEGHRLAHLVRRAATRMGELIDGLLDLSRISRSTMRLESTDLSPMAHEIATELHRTEPDRAADFVIAPRMHAIGDVRLLRVALENLMANAWKFTATKTTTRIEVGMTSNNGSSTVFVRDNGVGFDMEYADKLFGAFQRLHGDHEFEGTGIGLATVHRIAQRHGGDVSAEAVVGDGATFYLHL